MTPAEHAQRFRQDNTEGYTAEQLAELNRRYNEALPKYGTNSVRTASDPHFFCVEKSVADYVAERVLVEFDMEELP